MFESDGHVRALEIIASRAHAGRAAEVQRGAGALAAARGAVGALARQAAEGAAAEEALRERLTSAQARLNDRCATRGAHVWFRAAVSSSLGVGH